MKIALTITPESTAEMNTLGDILKDLSGHKNLSIENTTETIVVQPIRQEPVKQEPVKQMTAVKQEPVKQEPVKQEPVKQEPVDKKEATAAPTIEQVRAKTSEAVGLEEGKYKPQIRELLTGYGVKSASLLPEDKWQDYLDKLAKITNP